MKKKRSKTITIPILPIRNPTVALLKMKTGGGIHDKGNKAKRRQLNVELKKRGEDYSNLPLFVV